MDAGITAMLLEDADPAIRGAIRRKLRVTLRPSDYREQNLDALDLLGDVRVKLLHKLGQFAEIDRAGIAEFRSYAATVAYHCCADYLRAKYPQRTSLKNCLRRLLDKADGYAAWTSRNGDVLCGFAGWQGGGAAATAEQVARLRTSPERLLEHVIPRASAQNISATDWLRLLEGHLQSGRLAMKYSITTEGFRLAYDRVGYGTPVVLRSTYIAGSRGRQDPLVL